MKTAQSLYVRILSILLPTVAFVAFGAMQLLFHGTDLKEQTSVPPTKDVIESEEEAGDEEPPDKFFKNWYAPYDDYNPELQLRAMEQIKRLPTEAQIVSSGKNNARMLSSHSPWVQKGPFGMLIQSTNPEIYNSGRISCMDYHPSKGFLFGTAEGGLWKQFGIFVAPITDDLPSLSMGAVTFDPTNSNRVFLGTGEYQGLAGTGMYRSIDGGANWEPIPLDI